MLTVACVCVPGGVYTDAHVARLSNMVSAHLKQPHGLAVHYESDKPGFWAKIDLFKPGRYKGRVLYLDLDVTIIGSLDDLANYPHPFSAISDYLNPLVINSSVMAWDAGTADRVYTDFTPDAMKRLNGDQNWINEKVNAVRFPRRWCPSYKVHILPTGKVPADARVIVFHGVPRPWEVPLVA